MRRLYIRPPVGYPTSDTMRLTPLLGLMLWVVVAGGQDPVETGHLRQYHQQDGQGRYRFGYNSANQMAKAEGDPNSEVKGMYAYIDKNGDMQGVEYTAGIKGYLPKLLSKEDAEASMLLVSTITQPISEVTPSYDHLVYRRYQNRPGALAYNKRGREIQQTDNAEEETEIAAGVKDAEKTEVINTNIHNEEKTIRSKEETVQGKYTFIEEDGLPATIEYEAGPEIGFVVKSFTKESLLPRLIEKDAVHDKDGLTVREEKSPDNEEGTEETYPEGFVRGLYTFKNEDGIPTTVEYEAGPKMGFVVTKFSKGEVEEVQDTGTSLSNDTVIVTGSIKDDSSEGESVKFNGNNNKNPLENVMEEYSSPNSRAEVLGNQEYNRNDDSAQTPSFTTDLYYQQNKTRIHNLQRKDLVEQPDEEEEEGEQKEVPMNAAYRFGYSVKGQSRHEESDSLGNVHGNYSYVDGAGLLTKVKYEAGAERGFVIKQITHEHTKTPKTATKSKIQLTQDLPLTEKDNGSNKQDKFNGQREYLDETIIGGYEASPYVLREYVDDRNLPVRSELDSTVASGSTKHFSFAHPESRHFTSDGSYNYRSPKTNEATQQHYFPREANTEVAESHYSIFFRNPNDLVIQHEAPRNSNEYFSNTPYTELIPEYTQTYENVLNKGVEPYKTESNPGFSVYGLPNVNLPVSFDQKKTGVHQQKHQQHKKIVKHQMKKNQNFTNLQPDGSYSFAYKTKDHSREQSIDRKGHVNLRYQIKSKKYGNTLVIFSTQVPKHLLVANDEGMMSQEKDQDYFADLPVHKPYDLRKTIHPSNYEFLTHQHVSRDINLSPNRKQRVIKRGFFRKPRFNIKAEITSSNTDTISTPSKNLTESSN